MSQTNLYYFVSEVMVPVTIILYIVLPGVLPTHNGYSIDAKENRKLTHISKTNRILPLGYKTMSNNRVIE